MKRLITIFLSVFCMICHGQSIDKLILIGNYSSLDSSKVIEAYLNANRAVENMYNTMNSIWIVERKTEKSKKSQRIEKWENNETFMTWLGQPITIKLAHRKIRKIYSKFQKKIILEVTKDDDGRCNRWISAWAIPYGKVRIRLCRNFFNFSSHIRGKILIHELGHEAGMLFHRRIYGCRAAKFVASSNKNNQAKRSPENYAWLAMSYQGLRCSY